MPPPVRSALSKPVIETLTALADRLVITQSPWWLIGGAAVAVQGLGAENLADVDVIMDASDARRVLHALGVPADPSGGSRQFRSEVFGHWLEPPIPVDVMGDFQVRSENRWRRVEPKTREPVIIEGRCLYTPSRQELIVILRMFGRPKDLARADLLSQIDGR